MPTTRPLAFALIVALAAGSAAPDSLAAKKPAAKKKSTEDADVIAAGLAAMGVGKEPAA